jgi:hypothetical protein
VSQSLTLDLTHEQLIAQPRAHDWVLRAICLEHDCDYLAAMTRLEEWSNDARLDNGGKPVELSRVISDYSPIAITQFNQDVLTLEWATEKVLSLDRAANPEATPAPEGEVDESGTVLLDNDVDRARLLTDPYELERAYLTACDLDPSFQGTDGRQRFEQAYRSHVEAGKDYVATLQREQHRREIHLARSQAEARQQRWEENERRERARKHAAREQIQDLRKKL